jgi:predicted enzyme related to lactoylglutathione lyase
MDRVNLHWCALERDSRPDRPPTRRPLTQAATEVGSSVVEDRQVELAKTLYSKLLGVEPYMDEAYYVGFRVGDQEIGVDPNGHNQGMTGLVGYFHLSDIQQSLQALLDASAQTQQEVRDVGGGKLIASVKDADGNIIGLLQFP